MHINILLTKYLQNPSVCQSIYSCKWQQPSVCLHLNLFRVQCFLAQKKVLLSFFICPHHQKRNSFQQHLVTEKPTKKISLRQSSLLFTEQRQEKKLESVCVILVTLYNASGLVLKWEFWLLWRGETEWPSQGGFILSTGTKSPGYHTETQAEALGSQIQADMYWDHVTSHCSFGVNTINSLIHVLIPEHVVTCQ